MLKLVIIIFFISCNYCNAIEETVVLQFSERIMNLSLELFYYTEREIDGPVVMAPFTIWNLISLVAFRTGADTWRQMQSVLGIPKRNGKQFNSMFMFINDLLVELKPGRVFKSKQVILFDSDIENCMSKFFPQGVLNAGVGLMRLNFDDNVSAAESANAFIQLSTYSWIPKNIVFDKIDFEETSMIVSGLVEFTGAWSVPFDESNTILEDGYKGMGKVNIMRQWANVRYAEIELLGASALELPFGEDQEYSMIIIRPQEGLSVSDVLKNFAKITFLEVIKQLYLEGVKEVEVNLPKFSITSNLMLNGPLTSMGAGNVFLWNLADFSGILSEDIYISTLEHRATVMVGEGGTVIMAHTPGNFAKNITQSSYDLGKPFLYFLVHRQYMSVVFCGKYGK